MPKPHSGTPASANSSHRGFDPELPQSAFELEFFGSILERSPDFADVIRRQSELLYRYGRHREALTLEERLIRIAPADCVARYNRGCTLALLGRTPEALESLEEAIHAGYGDLAHMESDPDLDRLRNHPRYAALVRMLLQKRAQHEPVE